MEPYTRSLNKKLSLTNSISKTIKCFLWGHTFMPGISQKIINSPHQNSVPTTKFLFPPCKSYCYLKCNIKVKKTKSSLKF